MKTIFRFFLINTIALSGIVPDLRAQPDRFRPPAIPLITCDPYFSVWSFTDRPTDDWSRHWTGAVNALCGMIRIDGRTFRLLGRAPQSVPAMASILCSVIHMVTRRCGERCISFRSQIEV